MQNHLLSGSRILDIEMVAEDDIHIKILDITKQQMFIKSYIHVYIKEWEVGKDLAL